MPNGELLTREPKVALLDLWTTYQSPMEQKAPHLGHSKHLCNMADQGVALETVKVLVRNPKFICKKCGRAAAKEENLCEPVML